MDARRFEALSRREGAAGSRRAALLAVLGGVPVALGLRPAPATAGLLLGAVLGLAVEAPAQAGHGNHAQRAAENIQTRVAIAKVMLLAEAAEAAERQAIAEAIFAKQLAAQAA